MIFHFGRRYPAHPKMHLAWLISRSSKKIFFGSITVFYFKNQNGTESHEFFNFGRSFLCSFLSNPAPSLSQTRTKAYWIFFNNSMQTYYVIIDPQPNPKQCAINVNILVRVIFPLITMYTFLIYKSRDDRRKRLPTGHMIFPSGCYVQLTIIFTIFCL